MYFAIIILVIIIILYYYYYYKINEKIKIIPTLKNKEYKNLIYKIKDIPISQSLILDSLISESLSSVDNKPLIYKMNDFMIDNNIL